ncbi:MAG: hypothetical protein N2508_13260 [Anaerolineae bacterium]|nr:hypothetical protein [Anaerolineae bacterium]
MNGRSTFRFLALLLVGLLALGGIGGLMMFLSRGARVNVTPALSRVPIPSPGPTEEQAIATVNGHPIPHSLWVESVLLDQVMSTLAGQPASTPEETLQRLINEVLILEAFPAAHTPSAAEIAAHIARLEQGWGVDDRAVVMALQRAGLDRSALERAVGRLLRVQAGLEALRAQGYEESTWLERKLAESKVVINTQLQRATLFPTPPSIAAAPTPTPPPSPTAPSSPPSSPTPAGIATGIAPDFTLERVDGGLFTLTQQLAAGPVVLVFFQRCG